MPAKLLIALSAFTMIYTCCAQAALAHKRVNAGSTNHSQLRHCDPQDLGKLSPSSDFVDIPYTFGNAMEYRPAWIEEVRPRTDNGRSVNKIHTGLSHVHHC